MTTHFRAAYVVLLVLLVAAVMMIISAGSIAWSDLGLNLLTEIIGIGVTLFFIDRAFRAQEAAREKKYAQVVHQRLRLPLNQHLALWSMIFRSAHENLVKKTMPGVDAAKVPIPSLGELLASGNFDMLVAFDPRENARVHPPIPWAQYLVWELNNFKTQLAQILDAYAIFLSPEELQKVEACLHSNLMFALPQLLQVSAVGGKTLHPFYAKEEGRNQVASFVSQHLTRIRELVEVINVSLEEKERIRL